MVQPDDVEMPEMLVCSKVGHSEAINLITAVVATFGDTPSQFTRAEPSFDKYLLDENVRCNESKTSSKHLLINNPLNQFTLWKPSKILTYLRGIH